MPVTCTECRTSNRDGARFCKGCGRRIKLVPLDEEWPATQRMVYPGEELQFRGAGAVLPASHRIPKGPPAPARPPAPPPVQRAAEQAPQRSSVASAQVANDGKTARRIRPAVWVVVAVMLIAGAGWYALGSHQYVPPPATPAIPTAAPAPAPIPEATPSTAAVEPPIAVPVPASEPPPVVIDTKPPKQPTAPKARKQASAPAPPPAVPAEVQAPAPAPAPEPAPPANPQAACGNLNFFSRARCMAAQCAKPEFAAHSQCDAVRRQQQIEEEKRNPSLLN